MNRSKILESFSNKFKTGKMRDEFSQKDRKLKKERLRMARRMRQEEDEMNWEPDSGDKRR